MVWHQTGIAYQEDGQPEAAEGAYQKALQIKVQLGNVAGQASTLNQLGSLYDDVLDRPEEAADKYVESGDAANECAIWNNLARTLRRLKQLDAARREIERAIECYAPFDHAAQPWKTWAILAAIETDAGNPAAAAEARAKDVEAYLAYRRAGGENHDGDGRIALAVTAPLLAGNPAAAAAILQQYDAHPELPDWIRPFIQALQAIAAGSRDRALAGDPALYYRSAAEVLFLIETLEQARP